MAESENIGTAPDEDLMPSSRVEPAEMIWVYAVVGILVVMLTVVVVFAYSYASQPPSNMETIDPASLHVKGEFVESNLGSTIEPDGTVTVRVIANQYNFTPSCILVPADRKIRMRLTSPDVIHGFNIYGTNVNSMIVPGFVSQVYTRFRKIGDHRMPCHEFCGVGHHDMWANVKVIDAKDWPRDKARVSCD